MGLESGAGTDSLGLIDWGVESGAGRLESGADSLGLIEWGLESGAGRLESGAVEWG